MISDDYGGAGTTTVQYITDECTSGNEICFEHAKEALIDYIMKMLLNDIEEEKE